MFNTLIESSIARDPTRKGWSVIVSAMAEIAAVSILVLIPLIYTQALPKAMLAKQTRVTPLAPAESQPRHAQMPLRPYQSGLASYPFVAPAFVPENMPAFTEPEIFSGPIGIGISDLDAALPSVLGTGARSPSAPEVRMPTPLEPASAQRIWRGGSVQQALLISQSKPEYPYIAIQTRTQGQVVLHAIIDKQGKVSELEVISGSPLLIRAALDAVRQWRYRPTLLNGEPVEVDTTITVTFTLAN